MTKILLQFMIGHQGLNFVKELQIKQDVMTLTGVVMKIHLQHVEQSIWNFIHKMDKMLKFPNVNIKISYQKENKSPLLTTF